MAPSELELGAAELEVLRALWDHGPSTVREVMNHLHEAGRRVAYTTVLTFLSRLEQKGCVASDRSELAYRYSARVTRERISRSRLRVLLEELYDGAAAPLVLQLVRDERFSAEELAQLQSLLDGLDTEANGAAANRKKKGNRPRGQGEG